MSLLTLNHINFKYDKCSNLILEEVNLELQENSINVIIGPSGIGKSTLFHLIAGYITPTSGTISMNKSKITAPNFERGVVFQDMALYPWLTVQDNILFGPTVRKLDYDSVNQQLDHLLQSTGLSDFRKSYPYELSGGLKQRVALARAFINKPPLLMLDESFSALDNYTREEMHNILFKLWEETKNCIVVITHDIDEAIYLGQQIIVMNNHPGTITEQIENPFFRQDISTLILQDEYIRYRQQLLEAIR